MNIEKIDKNFQNFYSIDGMTAYNVNDKLFKLYGLCREEGETDFKRLPHLFVNSIDNAMIKALYKNTSGIRVRFKTNSKRIVLKCVLPRVSASQTMPLTGTSCFDLYADGNYCNVFRPGINLDGGYCDTDMGENGFMSGYTFHDNSMRDILINFPLYNDVDGVYIYLENDCAVESSDRYAVTDPVVFYGSSITQGGCASHPGNCYCSIISRRLDCDFVNLGFSAGCLAESEMAEYISSLSKSVLVYDYDHNASTIEYLSKTHERFFKEIREAEPDLPVVIVSAADLCFGEKLRAKRRDIIRKTYENALRDGDKNVWFVDGSTIYKDVGPQYCTTDNTHPNDLGFWCMAKAIGEVLETILKRGL